MGSASCKNQKSPEQDQKKEDSSKKITIGVFGLHNAGKTSAVKAIEGVPTTDVEPTMSFETTKVPHPITGKGDSKSQERITIIDLSGAKRFRQRSWPDYYKKIHGLIFVIDASEKKSMTENKETLEGLLENEDLTDKPILILANKQDQRNAINKEENIKDKLQIEKLRRKHKIEFCTAIPNEHNKADVSIRQGFTWLIRTIENDYTKINSHVINETNSRPPKPMERKSQMNTKRKDSDDSDKDDGVVYPRRRTGSPPLNKKTTDYRGISALNKLPNLDLNKTQKKRSGHDTHSASDDEERDSLSRLRPNISHPISNIKQRDQSFNLPSLTSTGGLNTKKATSTIGTKSDLPTKKSNDNEPKSFRSAYEQFPEESPWSTGIKKPVKYDELASKSFNKPSITNDLNKRISSPLVRDTKPFNSSTIQKRDNASDDDDGFNQKSKAKSTIPSINKPSSTFKKPLSTTYGMDDDDDYLKGSSNPNRRLNITAPIITKKPYDDDDENDYLKKATSKSTKSFDSDEENKKKPSININKPYQSSTDRYNLLNEYRGTTSKPPPSPSMKTSLSKFDDHDRPSALSSKLSDRSKPNKDDYLSKFSKPTTSSRFQDDEDDERPASISRINPQTKHSDDDYPSSLSKLSTRPKYGADNRPSSPFRLNTHSKSGDNDRPLSSIKPSTRSRFDNDDDDLPSISKPTTRSNYTIGDRPGSALKSTTRSRHSDDDDDDYGTKSKPSSKSKFDDDDDYGSKSKPSSKSKFDDDDDDDYKPTTRSNYKDNNRSSSPAKPASRSKFEDDDDDYKPSTRSNYKDNNQSSSPAKPVSRSKFEDDDDDYKPSTRSNYKDNNRSSSPAKPASRSKFEDDDDDYKPSTRSNYKDNDRSSSPAKPSSRSKFEDDDDDYKPTTRSNYKDNYRSSSPAKPSSRSKFEDDDDDDDRSSSATKPVSRSKFEDDDDDFPSVKKTNYSSRDNDSSGIGGTRSRYGKDDYDSSKGGFNSGRAGSALTGRYQSNYKFDT